RRSGAGNGAVSRIESTGSKERDVAVDSKWAQQRGPRQRHRQAKDMGATTRHARACARQG
ncbi:hypothetical protein SB783_42630, partial [Paraburkholderia sp. SIMBA_009]